MKRILFGAAIASIPLLLLACPPPVPPDYDVTVYPPYGGEAAVDAELPVPVECRLACEALDKAKCPEALPAGRTCGSVCAMAVMKQQDLGLLCIASKVTPAEIRSCGTVRCLGR